MYGAKRSRGGVRILDLVLVVYLGTLVLNKQAPEFLNSNAMRRARSRAGWCSLEHVARTAALDARTWKQWTALRTHSAEAANR
jgi:hypothetical protein